MPRKIKVNVGERFGKLSVLKEAKPFTNSRNRSIRIFLCKCDCGRTKEIRLTHLRNNGTNSCGCLRGNPTLNGLSNSKEYKIWCGMKLRCSNIKNNRYGGRGIKVCERWADFANFLKDMGERPTPQHSLDRINNDGNYEPSNCRWATRKEQANNTSRNFIIEHNGEKLTKQQWADKLNIEDYFITNRLKYGWSIKKTLETPPKSLY